MARDPDAKASLARARLIHQLRASDEPGAAALADIFDACTPAHPCRSAACPVCGPAFQATAVALVDEFIRVLTHGIDDRLIRQRLRSAGWSRDGP